MSSENLIGIFIVLLSAGLIFINSVARLNKKVSVLRPIQAVQRMRRAIGLTVEEGKRLHISLGKANLLAPDNASALIGLSTLERLAQISMISDRPPVATSGEGAFAILSQDTLRAVYRSGNVIELYNPDRGRLGGPTTFSYVAGTIPVICGENVSANIFVGNFGPEIALLCDAADRQKAFSLAASNSLPGQAVLYAAAQEPLIGEELFALPAYLKAGDIQKSSVRAQDLLRWIVMILLVLAVIFKIIGPMIGMSIL